MNLAVVPVSALQLSKDLVATAGSWSRAADTARFTPLYPPIPGSEHAVVVRPAQAGAPWPEVARARVPEIRLNSSTFVERIDPGTASVPENLLRFSVSFSAPMEEGGAVGHVHLLTDDGVELGDAWLRMPPELWDRPRRRLTVLLDPGRIKRGLRPNLQQGAPLVAGRAVTFLVDRELGDATGATLVAGASRRFLVGEPIRSRVDPTRWTVQWPSAADDAVTVEFGRPLDRALVRRCLRVVDRDGHGVAGQAVLGDDATSWTFRAASGLSGPWRLVVHPDLEDLAGNSVRRVFDRDLRGPDDGFVGRAPVVLSANG